MAKNVLRVIVTEEQYRNECAVAKTNGFENVFRGETPHDVVGIHVAPGVVNDIKVVPLCREGELQRLCLTLHGNQKDYETGNTYPGSTVFLDVSSLNVPKSHVAEFAYNAEQAIGKVLRDDRDSVEHMSYYKDFDYGLTSGIQLNLEELACQL